MHFVVTLVVLCYYTCVVLSGVPSCLKGVNLSGLEFGALPGVFNKDYTVPTNGELTYYMSKGMNTFRLPFKWERLQPTLNAPLDPTYLGIIDGFINDATGKGAFILLDPHAYARYNGVVIGEAGVPVGAFADLWQKLAAHYKNNPNILFGLMNEPHDMDIDLWLSDANAAIAAIRSTGANQTITVPGIAWTGAWSWVSSGNSKVMLGVKDPINNFIFEVHQYMDTDGSGTHDTCVSATIGSERLAVFTAWAKQHGYKAILGEWAGGRNDLCYSAITDITNHMDQNKDVYVGWTWWGGGPWWGTYMFALDPIHCTDDEPQMQYLVPHLCK